MFKTVLEGLRVGRTIIYLKILNQHHARFNHVQYDVQLVVVVLQLDRILYYSSHSCA